MLIAAELIIHLRIRPVVSRFVERRIVIPEDLPKFQAAIDSAIRLRNSVSLEVGLLILVWTVGIWSWRSQIALGTSSWYAILEGVHWHLTAPGCWYTFVSIPIFQFILVRWYLRLLIWFRFLWRVSRLNLRLTSTHPDRAGGLAFLGKSSYAFGPFLFAQGAMLAGLIASRVLYQGESLLAFKMEAAPGGFLRFVHPWPTCHVNPASSYMETKAQMDRVLDDGRQINQIMVWGMALRRKNTGGFSERDQRSSPLLWACPHGRVSGTEASSLPRPICSGPSGSWVFSSFFCH